MERKNDFAESSFEERKFKSIWKFKSRVIPSTSIGCKKAGMMISNFSEKQDFSHSTIHYAI